MRLEKSARASEYRDPIRTELVAHAYELKRESTRLGREIDWRLLGNQTKKKKQPLHMQGYDKMKPL